MYRVPRDDVNSMRDGALCDSSSPPFSLLTFFKELFESYKEALRTAPIITKSITSATIAILGEIFGCYITCKAHKKPFKLNMPKLKVFALYGLIITGPVLHFWYSLLEKVVCNMNLTGISKTIAKLVFDRLLFGPPFVLFTVAFLQYLQTFSIPKTIEYIKSSYWKVLIMNEQVWTVAQAVNFEVVPVDFQVLFVNAVAIGWNTMLSLVS